MPSNDFQFAMVPEGYAISTRGMKLTFVRTGDRWTHSLTVTCPGVGLEPIAWAVESEPTRDDPARVVSPVYQDIQDHPVQGGEGACVLLTGQATPHHFSAVVTARREGPSHLIEVDIADRCRAPIDVLAATYRVQLGSNELIDAEAQRIVWGGGTLGLSRLEFATRGVDDVALAEAGRGRATRAQAVARLVPSTYTQRLYYSWRWTPAGESNSS
jgi:hypothetical protein